ncbi:hypothetical protein [Streptomyces sp. NPDC046909]|uniref:hypothetical protein n=1 Tax=Streptomyces sp. NPDC046909 TaxID=3155617 RepID=UPI0033EE1D9B
MSAGPRPARATFRQHLFDHPAPGPLLLPVPTARRERSAIGTAVDQRLRLAFTAAEPLDRSTAIGIALSSRIPDAPVADALIRVGTHLAQELSATAACTELDARRLPLARTAGAEDRLARILLAAAWYAVAARAGAAFLATPLYRAAAQDPDGFTLDRLLVLPRPEVVGDVVQQIERAAESELGPRRQQSLPGHCVAGPGFPGQQIGADADLVVDGLLLDFKSTTLVRELSQHTLWQLLGYLLLDREDRYRIDSVGIYLTRRGTLVHWSVPDFLNLLGARRRDLPVLRAAVAQLLARCEAGRPPGGLREQRAVEELLTDLAPNPRPGHCLVCSGLIPSAASRGTSRRYCSTWCTKRSSVVRRRHPRRTAP